MTLDDLPTPCLVLDRSVLRRNLARMAAVAVRHGVALRPHMKTAKSIDVARLAIEGEAGGITVSTLAEAEYFASHGLDDIVLAVGITPQRLARVVALNQGGARIAVLTDDPAMAARIGALPSPPRTLIEIDTGEGRGGLSPDSAVLDGIADRLGPALEGVLTHGGHSYAGRSASEMADIAEAERSGAVAAALRLRARGHACPTVSVGSTPTALHARHLDGVTELRPGVYMFGDLFQAAIGSHGPYDIAVSVLASVIGLRPAGPGGHRMLIDAGALALSKDRSTAATDRDRMFGLVQDRLGRPTLGESVVERTYQEHGVVRLAEGIDPALAVGDLVRVLPNHTCLTAAAYDRYYVVDPAEGAATEIVAAWPRVNGW